MRLNDRLARLRHGDDSGAALVLALVFVVVVAIVLASVLSFADASLRATIATRSQAAQTADADGAAEVAINNLRLGSYVGPGSCFGGSSTLTLDNFYQPPTGPADSAAVTCEQDTVTSVPSIATTRPGYALLTLGNSALEDGVYLKANGNGGVKAQGAVGARSNINIDHGNLNVAGDVNATSCSGNINVTGGTQTCTAAAGAAIVDPNYPTPPAPDGTVPTMPTCKAYMQFNPGTYSSVTALNNAMSCNKAKVYDFRPGFYYFTYSGVWTISDNTMVAGSPTQLSATPPAIPGACPNLINTITPPATDTGVTFVFGGSAQMNITGNAQVEICGRYSSISPPIAFFGLKSNLGTMTAQNGCVTAIGTAAGACQMLFTDQNSTNTVLYLWGTVYAPKAWIDVDLRKSTTQYFNDGVVARRFSVFAPASAIPPTPLASLPIDIPGPARTVVVLTVYVCPGQSTCTVATGRVRLKVKVGIGDPASRPVPGSRDITVYSWGVQR